MKFFIEWRTNHTSSRGITLDANLFDSVRYLKGLIQTKVSIPASRQSLVFEGRQLEDDRILADLVVHGDPGTLLPGSRVLLHDNRFTVEGSMRNMIAGSCLEILSDGTVKVRVEKDIRVHSEAGSPAVDIVVQQADLKILAGTVHHPLFLFEDFEVHAHTHDVKVLIGPTKIMKNADHRVGVESESGVKSRVFSLQVECGTCTMWYSKLPQEVVSFFSRARLGNLETDLHHTMPLMGVIDLRLASMYESGPCNWTEPITYPLTIDLRESQKNPTKLLSVKYFTCLKSYECLRIFFPSKQSRQIWIEKLQSCNVFLGSSANDRRIATARSIDSSVERAFRELAQLSPQVFQSHVHDANLRIYCLALSHLKDAARLFEQLIQETEEMSITLPQDLKAPTSIKETEEMSIKLPQDLEAATPISKKSDVDNHSIVDVLQRRRGTSFFPATATFDSFQKQAVRQKLNVAAFCIAAIFSAQKRKKLLLNYDSDPVSLFDAEIESPTTTTISSAEALKMSERAVLNSRQDFIGKVRLSALEDKEASVMQQFCGTTESDSPEYVNLLSQTLICLSGYLHQRSDKEKQLHPHFGSAPHRHSQLFNRTWCRLAELRYDTPMLNFALLQIDYFMETHKRLVPLLSGCQYGSRKAGKIAHPEFKRFLVDKMLFLGRYRVPKQELPHVSPQSIVIFANDTAYSPDGTGSHNKVILKIMASEEHYNSETTLRENVFTYHRNQSIREKDVREELFPQIPPIPNAVESASISDAPDASALIVSPQKQRKCSGYLMKKARTNLWTNWKKHEFELEGLELTYKDGGNKNPIVFERGCWAQKEERTNSNEYCPQECQFQFPFRVVVGSSDNIVIQLAAESETKRDEWIECFNVNGQVHVAECSGWLFKKARSSSVPKWAKRFFRLDVSKRRLIYFRDTKHSFGERKQKFEQLCEDFSCEKVDNRDFLDLLPFESGYKFFFRVKRNAELLFELAAQNESDRNMWISEINKLCSQTSPGTESRFNCPFCDNLLPEGVSECPNPKCSSRMSEELEVQQEPKRLLPIDCCMHLEKEQLGTLLSQHLTDAAEYANFKHLIIMPMSGRNLHDVIDNESSSLDYAKTIVSLIKAVKYMHDAGFVHGDLKPKHFVRYEGEYALINLHASTSFGKCASWKKSSSGYLPPEAICIVDDCSRIRDYQDECKDGKLVCRCAQHFDTPVPQVTGISVIKGKVTLSFCGMHPFSKGQDVLLSGFSPEYTSTGVAINTTISSFCISDCTEKSIELIICDEFSIAGDYVCQQIGCVSFGCLGLCGLAHPSHDMWALGVLIFRLVSRQSLFHETVDDNLIQGTHDWNELAQWTDAIKHTRLKPIDGNSKNLKDLIFKLLEKHPWNRPKRVGEMFLLDYFASELMARQYEEIEAELREIRTKQPEAASETKFSSRTLLMSDCNKGAELLRNNMSVPEYYPHDLSLDAMESEVNALCDCFECAEAQAQALQVIGSHDHSKRTLELAQKLKAFKNKCCEDQTYFYGHKERVSEEIKRLYGEIQACRQKMEESNLWYYGCNLLPSHVQPYKLAPPNWDPSSTSNFQQPLCQRCQNLCLDWSSISRDMHYILHEPASEKECHNGIRDKGRAGMRLDDFMESPTAKAYHTLTKSEVAAIRFYTSHSYPSINSHLRKNVNPKDNKLGPHPFRSIVENIINGVKKLRASKSDADSTKILWRGLSNVSLTDDFRGGTEDAFMSTSSDFKVALQYSIKSGMADNILFRIVTANNNQRGAEIQWLSMFPAESEFLYPPFTYLHADRNVPVKHIKQSKMSFRVVTVSSDTTT